MAPSKVTAVQNVPQCSSDNHITKKTEPLTSLRLCLYIRTSLVAKYKHSTHKAGQTGPTQRLLAAVHWLCVGAIIAEFNIGGYQYALTPDALRTR